MAWAITVDEPMKAPWGGKDVVGWVWEIEQDDETRRILVEVSGTAMAVDPETLNPEVREARETRGRSAVEAVLDRADPPGTISFSTEGRNEEPYRGREDEE